MSPTPPRSRHEFRAESPTIGYYGSTHILNRTDVDVGLGDAERSGGYPVALTSHTWHRTQGNRYDMPALRSAVLSLEHKYNAAMERADAESVPSGILRAKQQVIDITFNHIVEQITCQCVEQGDLLNKLRQGYAFVYDGYVKENAKISMACDKRERHNADLRYCTIISSSLPDKSWLLPNRNMMTPSRHWSVVLMIESVKVISNVTGIMNRNIIIN